MKTYVNSKRRAKPTELKPGDDVLVKLTGRKGKLISYWKNDLFTIAKVNGPTIIIKRKKDEKVFARNISMVRNISTLVIRMTIQISIVAELQKMHIQTIEEIMRTVSIT